jgi:hypothetical protein
MNLAPVREILTELRTIIVIRIAIPVNTIIHIKKLMVFSELKKKVNMVRIMKLLKSLLVVNISLKELRKSRNPKTEPISKMLGKTLYGFLFFFRMVITRAARESTP